jgi:hypothetical protein
MMAEFFPPKTPDPVDAAGQSAAIANVTVKNANSAVSR